MKPLKQSEIVGNWATLLLPLHADDSIDDDLLRAELGFFGRVGVNGVYSNGSAGEFFTQTESEFDRIHQLMAEECERLNLPFQIGASQMSPQLSLERIRRAKAFKPSAFQVIIPDWFPPTMQDVFRFLDTMTAAADPIPLIVYNPPHAKKKLGPADWHAIADRFGGVAGIKVPGGDETWYRSMEPVMSRLSVFIPGHTLATGLSRGAKGSYSNVACLSPHGAQKWYDLCKRDLEAGLKLEVKINRFVSEQVIPLITVRGLSNMAADKAMAVAGGWLLKLSPRIRWPYDCAKDEDIRRIGELAREHIPELFFTP